MKKVFVDGQEGTTGLKIYEYLFKRKDIEVLMIDSEKRKDIKGRQFLLNEADIVFLCLPDEASKESISLIENKNTCVIDASTAHRTNPEWAYGIPELGRNQRSNIMKSSRIAVPGCHATGFAVSLYPLICEGVVPVDYPVYFNSITGYSGGGKKMIHTFEQGGFLGRNSPMHYALDLNHKHLPEMQAVTGITNPPVFTPIIGNYFNGMVTTMPLVTRLLNKKVTAEEIHNMLQDYYEGESFIRVMPYRQQSNLENGFLNAEACNNTNRLELFVYGKEDQILVMARFDNLGKGACGAAIQNMNLVLGVDEATGLLR